MLFWVIDRIEEDFALCETPERQMVPVPLAQLPKGVREGDCLRLEQDGYMIDTQETERRRAYNLELLKKLRYPRK